MMVVIKVLDYAKIDSVRSKTVTLDGLDKGIPGLHSDWRFYGGYLLYQRQQVDCRQVGVVTVSQCSTVRPQFYDVLLP